MLAACGAPAHPQQPRELVEATRVAHIDTTQAREAAIVRHPSGRLFVAGYGADEHPSLWRSDDAGKTWSRIDTGGIGNSDVDLAVAPDGTLYFVNLLYDRTANEGKQIAIATSRDAGATWQWSTLSQARFDDRPWVVVSPDGHAHVIWSNEAGVHHAVSADRGATWTETAKVSEHGGSSHLAVGPHGELAARITPVWGGGIKMTAGLDAIAISTDGGATWASSQLPGTRDWKLITETGDTDTPRWVEPVAWDMRGDLYAMWTGKDGVHLARSHDRAATWSDRVIAHPPGMAFYPYLIALGPDSLAATWFTAIAPDGSDLRWHLARIDGDRVAEAPPQILECVAKHDDNKDDKLYNDSCGEYVMPIALDADIVVVGTIQNKVTKHFGFTLWRFSTPDHTRL
jgi:hypothetical protein